MKTKLVVQKMPKVSHDSRKFFSGVTPQIESDKTASDDDEIFSVFPF